MARRPSKHLVRVAWLALAYASLALAIIGIPLPGLPTTPFVLLAAFAADRGSPRLHGWLMRHRTFGPMIRSWERERAVSRRAKLLATGMMAASSAVMFAWGPGPRLAAMTTAIMAVVAIWLWRRPEPGEQGRAAVEESAAAAETPPG